jgi:hypothetical protein
MLSEKEAARIESEFLNQYIKPIGKQIHIKIVSLSKLSGIDKQYLPYLYWLLFHPEHWPSMPKSSKDDLQILLMIFRKYGTVPNFKLNFEPPSDPETESNVDDFIRTFAKWLRTFLAGTVTVGMNDVLSAYDMPALFDLLEYIRLEPRIFKDFDIFSTVMKYYL